MSSTITDGAASATASDVARERLEKKLQWRCRRGMKELDFLLLRYLRERHADAASDERAAFVEFLELPDPDIARYLLAGDVPTDSRHA
ncbi:MAG TPA: succinate dehydrogenase assembly factor 2, partial [Steroidobacteraceae bacterium]|nr:succinate dehydrogenase assembly factor 2 [Steroidobacteraceae bacterium]